MTPLKTDELRKLQQKKYRKLFGCFLAEGEHLVQELERAAQHNELLLQSELYVTEAFAEWPGPLRKHLLTEKQMAAISDTQNPQGIIARVPMTALDMPGLESADAKIIYLYEIQDPGNLGTVLRTLAWFGNFRCLLSPGSVDPFNPKVVRSSMGAIFHVPIQLEVPFASLKRCGRVACLDMQGRDLPQAGFSEFDCYLFGNEARGVPHEALQDLHAEVFTISGSGRIESLNLASAVNICAWEISRAH